MGEKKMDEKKEIKKEIKKDVFKEKKVLLNVNYLIFVKKILSEKLINVNIEKLNLEYENILNLKSSNCKRVILRVLRENNKEKILNYLKENNLKENDFYKLSNRLICENKKRNCKYI